MEKMIKQGITKFRIVPLLILVQCIISVIFHKYLKEMKARYPQIDSKMSALSWYTSIYENIRK